MIGLLAVVLLSGAFLAGTFWIVGREGRRRERIEALQESWIRGSAMMHMRALDLDALTPFMSDEMRDESRQLVEQYLSRQLPRGNTDK